MAPLGRSRGLTKVLVAGALAGWLVAIPGGAQEGSAAESFERGSQAFARRDYATAAQAFERAYGLQPHAAPLYNAGLARESAGEATRAADDYDEALRRGELSAEQSRDATARLGKLSRQLGRLDITGPAGARAVVGGVTTDVPARRYVTPGQHRIELVYASGQRASNEVRVEAGAAVSVGFVAVEAPSGPASNGPASSAVPSAPAASDEPARGPVTGSTRLWPFGLVAGGVVVVATSLYLGSRALAARDDYDASGHTDREARDRAVSLRTWTNVGLGVGGALTAAGVTLWLALPAQTTVGVSARGLTVGGSF